MPLTKLWLLVSFVSPAGQLHAPDPVAGPLGHLAPADTSLLEVRGALASGRPWQASRLVAPTLADSARRTPTAVYLAAAAASEWHGWREVGRLLRH